MERCSSVGRLVKSAPVAPGVTMRRIASNSRRTSAIEPGRLVASLARRRSSKCCASPDDSPVSPGAESGGTGVLDVGRLPAADARRGHPTPTVLYGGRDLVGVPEPVPQFPEPA